MKRQRPRWTHLVGVLALAGFVGACGSATKTESESSTATTTKGATATTAAASTTTAAPATTTTTPFDKKYGAFAPTTHQGSADGVVPVPAGAKAGVVAATYSGSSNFSIVGLDANNESTTDLLVNTIGAYTGTTAYGFGLSSGVVNLKVTASGPWTIKISPISSAPALPLPASGKGDAVYLWNGKSTNWAITNQGEGHFAVINNGSGLIGYDLLVNELGAYTGTVPVKSGPAVTTISSDGTWTIKST